MTDSGKKALLISVAMLLELGAGVVLGVLASIVSFKLAIAAILARLAAQLALSIYRDIETK